MESKFIVVIDDGSVIEVSSLQDLKKYRTAPYYFKKIVHDSQTSMFPPKRTSYSYYYVPIDIDGNEVIIKIGNLVLTDIGPDNIHYDKFHNRPIKFYDEELKVIRQVTSKIKGIDFLYTDLKINLDILKAVKSWDIFLKIKDYDKLKIENEKLKEELEKLKKS